MSVTISFDRDVVITNSVIGVMMFTALWWVMVNVPEYFNHATIYLFALLIYVVFSSVHTIPSYGFNTENISKQIIVGLMASAVIVLPFAITRIYGSSIASIVVASLSPVAVFFIVVVAPVVEEMFFRGLMLPLIAYKIGNSYVAVVITSLIFALYHYGVYGININSLIWLITLANILGALVVYTNSIIPAIILHMANNLVSILPILSVANNIISGVFMAFSVALISYMIYLRYSIVYKLLLVVSAVFTSFTLYTLVSPVYELNLYGELSALALIAVSIPTALMIVTYIARKHNVDITDMLAYSTVVITSLAIVATAVYLGVNIVLVVLGLILGVMLVVLFEENNVIF